MVSYWLLVSRQKHITTTIHNVHGEIKLHGEKLRRRMRQNRERENCIETTTSSSYKHEARVPFKYVLVLTGREKILVKNCGSVGSYGLLRSMPTRWIWTRNFLRRNLLVDAAAMRFYSLRRKCKREVISVIWNFTRKYFIEWNVVYGAVRVCFFLNVEIGNVITLSYRVMFYRF